MSPVSPDAETETESGTAAPVRALDNPVWAALAGPHAGLAELGPAGLAARYAVDVSPFAALADPPPAIRADGPIWRRWPGRMRRCG